MESGDMTESPQHELVAEEEPVSGSGRDAPMT